MAMDTGMLVMIAVVIAVVYAIALYVEKPDFVMKTEKDGSKHVSYIPLIENTLLVLFVSLVSMYLLTGNKRLLGQ